ncbi:MAG: aldose epimerase family protein [Cyanobacteria bacterium P01_A01_bin.84]
MEKTKIVKIENKHGLAIEILSYGATVSKLYVPNKFGSNTNVVVGLTNPEDYQSPSYEQHTLFLGASIGRYAGRLGGSSLKIKDKQYDIYSANGVHLHGGLNGLGRRTWKILNVNKDENPFVELGITSKHLDEGYPGNLEVTAKYTLLETNSLQVSYLAKTDRTTYVNLTNHAYFNLDGGGTILNHKLALNSLKRLEVDEKQLPTGRLLKVRNSRFDFTTIRKIGNNDFKGLDDTFVLNDNQYCSATLSSKKTGILMKVHTNQPSLVVFTPPAFPILPLNATYRNYGAICFEAQNYPNAPNIISFPSALLEPNEVYQNSTTFTFDLAVD